METRSSPGTSNFYLRNKKQLWTQRAPCRWGEGQRPERSHAHKQEEPATERETRKQTTAAGRGPRELEEVTETAGRPTDTREPQRLGCG